MVPQPCDRTFRDAANDPPIQKRPAAVKGIAAAGQTSLSTQCTQLTWLGVRAMRQRRPV